MYEATPVSQAHLMNDEPNLTWSASCALGDLSTFHLCALCLPAAAWAKAGIFVAEVLPFPVMTKGVQEARFTPSNTLVSFTKAPQK